MVKETCKFGVGMVLVGQSFEHFPTAPTSASVRLVLGCPEMLLNQTRRCLRLAMIEQDKRKTNPLSTIWPCQMAFVGVTSAGENGVITALRLALTKTVR